MIFKKKEEKYVMVGFTRNSILRESSIIRHLNKNKEKLGVYVH